MSRFADPSKVAVVPLGPCECPGTPHEQDEATVRWELSSSAEARIGAAQMQIGADFYAPYRQLIVEAVVSWNLMVTHEDKVVPVPCRLATVAEMDDRTLERLGDAINDLIESKGQLPNDSGAPSAESPQESASPTPTTTPKPGT